jgi:light-regulated signal transduction histidine kinase (bacteriophytochrome)
VHPEDWDQADAAVVDCIEGKSSRYEATFRMRHRDSSYRWILAQGQLIRDGDGEPDRMIGVHIDITDQQLAADELQQVNQNLSRSNDELEQFAYVASHDLQEPLRKVTSFCELLREDCEESLSEDGRRFLGYVVDGATRMRTLIQDLLSFSRIESQGQTHSLVDANKAVLRASRSLAAIIEEAGAEVTHDQLPEVVADSTQLTQLLQNLIGNAIKYNGNPIPQVHISSELRDASWVFSVRDNGIGIEPQYFEQIFGVFKRLHSMDTYRGTGIGLAICKRIVDRMSGEIWVESSPGEGSTFFFSVPNPVS